MLTPSLGLSQPHFHATVDRSKLIIPDSEMYGDCILATQVLLEE